MAIVERYGHEVRYLRYVVEMNDRRKVTRRRVHHLDRFEPVNVFVVNDDPIETRQVTKRNFSRIALMIVVLFRMNDRIESIPNRHSIGVTSVTHRCRMKTNAI
jgi:hypothetical protein